MFGLILISSALLAGTGGADVAVMNAAHNTTVKLRCTDRSDNVYHPIWYHNVSASDTFSSTGDTGELIGTLIINGSQSCGIFSALCRLYSGQIVHNIKLTVEEHLPSPENVHINESLMISWNPPYSANNNESSVMHVDPHITQYTVYTIDNSTGNYMDKVNVTKTSFRTNISDDHLCPMYCVTAWNSGGEGDMSAPLPHFPGRIAAEDVYIHREPGALEIHLNVTCTARTFLVTVMSTDGVIVTTVQEPVTTIHIALPQNVDDCNLIVRISSRNSAGTSSPTEIVVGCQTTGPSTDATTTATTTSTTSTGSDATSTALVDQNQQRDSNIIYIAIGIAVGAVVIVATGALLLIILWKCKRNTKVLSSEDNLYSKSPSLGGPPVYQLHSPPVYSPPAVYPTPEPLNWSQPPYSEPARTLSTDSDKSDDLLLPAPKPAQLTGGDHYADVETLQGKLKPPAQDDPVQYQSVLHQPVESSPPSLPPKRYRDGDSNVANSALIDTSSDPAPGPGQVKFDIQPEQHQD